MGRYICDLLRGYQISTSDSERLYSTYLTGCIFGVFLSHTAVMLNIITIHAMRNTSSLPKPLKTLLLSLAVSDLGNGLLCEPFAIALFVRWLQQNNPSCTTYSAFIVILTFFGFTSFCGVMVISMDRFMAMHLHLRYQELVTYNRVVAVVILLWVLSAFLSLIVILIPADVLLVVISVIGILCIVPTAFFNYKIYLTVRRHRNQIHALQAQQVAVHNGETANAASVRKSAQGTFYIYVVSMLCFVPNTCFTIAMAMSEQSAAVQTFSVYSFCLLFLNSSLNPVIYRWKMRNIRHTIINMLRSPCVRHP